MSSLAVREEQAAIMERVVAVGDLANLSPQERVNYYTAVCESVGLNPLTRPFEYIELNNKLTLYARKDATDQLRRLHNISITIQSREIVDDVYLVVAQARAADGRTDESIGAVPLVKEQGEWVQGRTGKRYFKRSGEFSPLVGDERANAMMKAETKAKRRVTLSICGLGWLDETELETIPTAQHVTVADSGEIETTPNGTWDRPDWADHFMNEALAIEDGYYFHPNHVKNALKKLGFTSLKRDDAEQMLLALAAHARNRVAEEQPAAVVDMDETELETIPF